VLEALSLATTSEVYELGQVYEAGMPLFGTRSYALTQLAKGPSQGDNAVVYNDEFIATQVGQVGTQFDGLGHIGGEVEFDDGSVDYVFYNGFTAAEMDSPDGLQQLGIEHLKPMITRGVLVDVAGYKGVNRLEGGYEVTLADVRGALVRQGIEEDSLGSGDAILFNYGWSELWSQPEAYNGDAPGIGLEVARWLIEREATLTGGDSWANEVVPNPDPTLAFPVHQEILMKNGLFNIENLQFDGLLEDEVYEFLFIATPIRFKGTTGSPLRPIAIR
jgi:kynurenine formamidase